MAHFKMVWVLKIDLLVRRLKLLYFINKKPFEKNFLRDSYTSCLELTIIACSQFSLAQINSF